MEEAFELISTGAWSIVPPLLALALALITKEVYSSLTIGVFVGMVIYQFTLNGVGVDQLVTAFTDVPNAMALQIADNGALLLFLALLGALTVVIATAGAAALCRVGVPPIIKNATRRAGAHRVAGHHHLRRRLLQLLDGWCGHAPRDRSLPRQP